MTPRPRRPRRWATRLAILTLVLAVLAGGAAWWVARGVVPPLEGQVSVPGLEAPVEVIFDRWGVPHVYARDTGDAWFAAGYLQARERFWQMELYRRAAAGRLSELFGEPTLPADRRFAALGLRRAAATEWAMASPRVKAALERHAAGVNAALAAFGRWTRPLELQVLGITPEPWTPIDGLAVGKLMAWRLAENRHGELVRGALARKFGSEAAQHLMGEMPRWAPTILESGERTGNPAPTPAAPPPAEPPPTAPAPSPPGPTVVPTAGLRQARSGAVPPGAADAILGFGPVRDGLPPGLEWLANTARPGGSNSWVVAGSRTATGRPLLANDPHLGIEMPSIWYEMHLVANDLDVAGVTLPGEPFVLIGHNQKIAWGLTNSGADVQDFYVEDVDLARRRYLHRGTWLPLRIDTREIGVRGRSAPEVFQVMSTRHGPLVALEDEWEEVPVLDGSLRRSSGRPLALRWESAFRGETAGAFEAINRAGSWQEFLEGVRRFGAPSQNFVYADVAGNIGYALSGLVPARVNGDGGTPVPGWTGDHEWVGTLLPEQLPARTNPPAGQFLTANAAVDRAGTAPLTRDWAAAFRTARIAALLGDRTGLDMAAFKAMQADVQSVAADRLMAAVERASRSAAMRRAEPEGRTALERLRLWDRKVDGRPVVTLYEAFVRALWRRTFADEMDARLFQQFFEYGLAEYQAGIFAIIEDPRARWWDDIATVDRRETRDDLVVLAAADALLALRSKFGDEPDWAWSRVHAARFGHVLAGGGPPFAWFFSRGPVAVPGDSWTVSKTSIDRRNPYAVVDVSSYRQILDVGAWDAAQVINTTGQSGHARSPHYFDQNPLWRRFEYRTFPFSRAAVETHRASRLLLVP